MKKYILTILFFTILSFNSYALDDLREIKKNEYNSITNILYDDDKYLYMKSKDSYIKLNKNFESDYEFVIDDDLIKKLEDIDKNQYKFVEDITYPSTKIESIALYLDNYKAIDMTEILNSNPTFYNNLYNNNYFLDVKSYNFDNGNLISLKLQDYIWKYYYFIKTNNGYLKLDIDSKLELDEILTNSNDKLYLIFDDNIVYYDLVNDELKNIVNEAKTKVSNEISRVLFESANNEYLVFKAYDKYYSYNGDEFEELKIEKSDLKGKLYISDKLYLSKYDIFGILNISDSKFKYFNYSRLLNNINRNDIVGEFKLYKNRGAYKYNLKTERNYYIPTYKVYDDIYIVSEDLENLGYKKVWDDKNNITIFSKDENKPYYDSPVRKNTGVIYDSDIDIIIKYPYDTEIIKAHNISGYSLINVKDFYHSSIKVIY